MLHLLLVSLLHHNMLTMSLLGSIRLQLMGAPSGLQLDQHEPCCSSGCTLLRRQ